MRMVFEKDDIFSEDFCKMFDTAFKAYKSMLREEDPNAEITAINVYISTRGEDGEIIDGLSNSGNAWLVKPCYYDEETLVRTGTKINTYESFCTVSDINDNDVLNLYKLIKSEPKPCPINIKRNPYGKQGKPKKDKASDKK